MALLDTYTSTQHTSPYNLLSRRLQRYLSVDSRNKNTLLVLCGHTLSAVLYQNKWQAFYYWMCDESDMAII